MITRVVIAIVIEKFYTPCSKKAAKTIENGLSSRLHRDSIEHVQHEQVTNIPKEVLERAVDVSVVTFSEVRVR